MGCSLFQLLAVLVKCKELISSTYVETKVSPGSSAALLKSVLSLLSLLFGIKFMVASPQSMKVSFYYYFK